MLRSSPHFVPFLFVNPEVLVAPEPRRESATVGAVRRDVLIRGRDGDLANVVCVWISREDWPIVAETFLAWATMPTPDGMVAFKVA